MVLVCLRTVVARLQQVLASYYSLEGLTICFKIEHRGRNVISLRVSWSRLKVFIRIFDENMKNTIIENMMGIVTDNAWANCFI
jgi:hypothetical protein